MLRFTDALDWNRWERISTDASVAALTRCIAAEDIRLE
jgi:hypothetical protein